MNHLSSLARNFLPITLTRRYPLSHSHNLTAISYRVYLSLM